MDDGTIKFIFGGVALVSAIGGFTLVNEIMRDAARYTFNEGSVRALISAVLLGVASVSAATAICWPDLGLT